MARKPRPIEERRKEAEDRLALERAQFDRDRLKLARQAIKAKRAALSTYRAAERNRTNHDWRAPNVSADGAVLPDQLTIARRARQMVRDNDYARSIVRAFQRNVVGTGITPTFASQSEPFNRETTKRWTRWAKDPKKCDIEGKRSFSEIQRWVIGELVAVGEALIIKAYKDGFCLQCVESEQLDNSVQEFEGREVRGGVEVDEWGQAVAYWVFSRHPNDIRGGAVNSAPWYRPSIRTPDQRDTREPYEKGQNTMFPNSHRIEADRVLHIFDPDRARQSRGISRLASCLQRLRDLDEYDRAQLLAARAEACIGLVVTTPFGAADDIGLQNEDDDNLDTNGNDELAMQPMMVARLGEGEQISSFTPTRPGALYDPFVTKQLRACAAGAGVSFEQVARDFTGGTYSSQRQGLLEDRREYEPLIGSLICHMCEPVAAEWLAFARLEGQINNQFPADLSTDWRGQGWEWIDPEKQAKGIDAMRTLGLTSNEREANLLGSDWRDLQDQIIREELRYEKRRAEIASEMGVENTPQEEDSDVIARIAK